MSVERNDDLLVPEEEIRGALRRHRPDAKRFADEVRAKIDARVDEKVVDLDTAADNESWRSAAASLFPIGLMTLGKGATSATSTIPWSQKLAWILAWPAASVFLILGVAILGVLGLRRGGEESDNGEWSGAGSLQRAVREWAQRHRMAGFVGMLLVFGTPFVLPMTWYFVFLLFSVAALVAVTRSLRDAGIAHRSVVASWCSSALLLIGLAVSQVSAVTSGVGWEDPRLLATLLMVGSWILLFVARAGGGALYARRDWMRRPVLAALFYLFALSIPLNGLLGDWTRDMEDVRELVEEYDRAPFRSASWSWWGVSAEWLHENGASVDWTKPVRLFEADESPDPTTVAIASRISLVDEGWFATWLEPKGADWQRLVNEHVKDRRIAWPRWKATLVREKLRRGALDPSERTVILARARETWNAAEDLEDLSGAGEILLLLKEDLAAPRYAKRAHELLLECWVPTEENSWSGGGFNQYPDLDHSNIDSTVEALQLIEHVGAPTGIEYGQVLEYLRGKQRMPLGLLQRLDDHRAAAMVGEARLERLGLVEEGAADLLRRSRTPAAALVLVLLCLYATFRARTTPRGN